MAEPTIICPQCKTEIKLTESLAAPLLDRCEAAVRARLAQKDTDMAKREQSLNDRAEAIEKRKASLDQQIAAKLQQERGRIAAEEQQKAKLSTRRPRARRKDQTTQRLCRRYSKQRDEKLAAAQNAQAEVIRKERELDDSRRGLELTIENAFKRI